MEGVEVSAVRDKHTKGYGLSCISWGSEHMCDYTAQPHMNISTCILRALNEPGRDINFLVSTNVLRGWELGVNRVGELPSGGAVGREECPVGEQWAVRNAQWGSSGP